MSEQNLEIRDWSITETKRHAATIEQLFSKTIIFPKNWSQAKIMQRAQEILAAEEGFDRKHGAEFNGRNIVHLTASKSEIYLRKAVVESDTDWELASTSNPSRGLRDYSRCIEFSADAIPEEIAAELSRIREQENPGWCGWRVVRLDERCYRLETTYDSSG